MRVEDLEREVSERRRVEQELQQLRGAYAKLEAHLRDSSANLDMAYEQVSQFAAIDRIP